MPQDIVRDFSGGVVQSLPSDKLPANYLYRAYDSAFRTLPGGTTVVTHRPGWSQKYDITDANNKNVVAIYQFAHNASGSTTRYVVSIASNGKLYMGTTNVSIPHSGGAFDPNQYWTFAVAGNVLYGVGIADNGGADRFKLYHNGSAWVAADIGVARPAAPTGSNGAGSMTGDYDFACAWYSSYTGHLTSRSDSLASTGLSSNKVTLTQPSSPPPDATHWRVYIRKGVLGVDFWQVAEVAVGTTTYEVNLTDTQINALTILAPDIAENDAPPANLRDLEWHQSRMFYTDGSQVYYSQPGYPEAVDPDFVELANKQDGQKIVGLLSLDANTLAVFKEKTIYALIGDGPQSWEFRTLVPATGAISKHIAKGDGLFAFWSHAGPTVWDGQSEPVDIANDVFREVLESTHTALVTSDRHEVVFDRGERRFLFHTDPYIGTGPLTESTWFHIWPWSTVHRVWESSGWEMPADLKTIAVGYDKGNGTYDTSHWLVYLGCGDGRIKVCSPTYRTDEAGNDFHRGLVFAITGSPSNNVIEFVAPGPAYVPNRSTTAVYPKACVIDGATLKVWRLGSGSFTVTNTVGLFYTLTVSDAPWGTTPPTTGTVVFDAPVVEVLTHQSQNTFVKHDYKLFMADVGATENHQYYLGFFRDHAATPARVWHADETSDIADIYPALGGIAQPEGYPIGVLEEGDPSATGTTRFFQKRIARSGFQHLMKFIGYFPGCRWYLKSLGVDFVERRDGW